jgi:hypothetical protein
VKELPAHFQFAPIYGMIAEDINGDGNLDLIASGNDYGNEVANGRYDALNGIVAYGDGKGSFLPKRTDSSGLYISGDGKALSKLRGANGKLLIAASQNRGPLKLFRCNAEGNFVPLHAGDRYAVVHYNNGSSRREEIYYGSSFLSQSSRILYLSAAVQSVDIFDSKGAKRTVKNNR